MNYELTESEDNNKPFSWRSLIAKSPKLFSTLPMICEIFISSIWILIFGIYCYQIAWNCHDLFKLYSLEVLWMNLILLCLQFLVTIFLVLTIVRLDRITILFLGCTAFLINSIILLFIWIKGIMLLTETRETPVCYQLFILTIIYVIFVSVQVLICIIIPCCGFMIYFCKNINSNE